jgi:catechol 2,3-dioxygenase-like lactoylglutathione lyase family enzyme
VNRIQANSLDHVALWVAERDPLADYLCSNLGMHAIERTDAFTLVGVDARRGKLTLFEAEGPRERGALDRVVLRVADLDRALERLPDRGVRGEDGVVRFEAPAGLGLGLVQREGLDYDLDHVVLRVADPDRVESALAELGFERRNGALAVADKFVRVEGGGAGEPERPLLNHLALLVDSAEDVRAEAEGRGLEIEKFVDAENTLAVFIRGPEGIVVEHVEHKPGFSLA